MKGRKPFQAAAREAYEEAGLRGAVGKRPLGHYIYQKRLKNLDAGLKKDPGDTQGPVSLAVAVGPADEKKPDAKTPRLVVVGNSRFATNGALTNGANGIFFANALHWLAGSEKQIGIAPKAFEQASMTLSDSDVRKIGIASVLGLPALAMVIGIFVWFKRRD